MKFKIKRDHFAHGLKNVIGVITSKLSIEIRGNVLLEADDGILTLTTTNLDQRIRVRVPASVACMGSVTLPARRLAEIVATLGGVEVEVTRAEKMPHKVQLACGPSVFLINGVSAADFPPRQWAKAANTFELSAGALARSLRMVAFAQSRDEARVVFHSVLLERANGKLNVVACDGRRLARSTVIAEGASSDGTILLPFRTVTLLLSLLDEAEKVTIARGAQGLEITLDHPIGTNTRHAGPTILFSREVSGSYPDYKRVIPQKSLFTFEIDRARFEESLHRVSLVTAPGNPVVAIVFEDNRVTFVADTTGVGDSEEVIQASHPIQNLRVRFNPAYLRECLSAVAEERVTLTLSDHLTPAVIRSGSTFECVVMPVSGS